MPLIPREEVVGLNLQGEIICERCVSAKEWEDMVESEIIKREQIENDENLYFCDRCEKQL